MQTLYKPVFKRWQRPATVAWDRPSRRWHASRRYVALLLALAILSVLVGSVSLARPVAGAPIAEQAALGHVPPGRAVQETALDLDLAHEADMRWAQGERADLRGQTLEGATLTGANLRGADLREADLAGAALVGAHLRDANLSGIVLRRADLHYTILSGADLRGADLRWANLQWTDLQDADLRNARLVHAHLHRAYLHGAILPDGTRWMPGSDLERFTDPRHDEYWVGGR